MSRVRHFGVLIFLVGLSAFTAMAQTEAINGSIRGQVTDQAGTAVSAAKVTIENAQTGFNREMETNEDGYYVFPNLPLGSYTVSIQKAGFNTERHPDVILDAGTEATIDAQLKIGSVSTSIEVSGGAPVVDPDRTDIGRTIGFQEVQNLPLTSRNPYNFILFQPGVSGHPNPELGIPRLLDTNGLVDRVNYQLDGSVDTETDRYGLRLFAIADSYVSEVQTVSSSFAPEFGKIDGDIYNVITGSGSNTFHGQVQFIGRPLGAVARPILATPTTPVPAANDFSANSGGKIIKDKLFFFASYEHIKRATPMPTTINPASAAQIGISSSLLATAPTVQHAQWVDVRLDWMITQKHQFFVRYNYFRNKYPFNTNEGGLYALDAASDFRDRAHVLGAQLLSTFSPNVLNELRFGWPYRNEQHIPDPLTGKGPEITINGIVNGFGGSTAVGDRFQEKVPNLNDNFTVIKGAHTFKAGFGFQQNLDTQAADIYTQYVFPNIAAYLSALSGASPYAYTSFNASVGQPGAWYRSFFWDFFAQDTWQITPHLVATYGVRYDQFRGPTSDPNAQFPYSQHFRIPEGDFAPRLGLAWQVTPKTVVRASSGIFYEATPTNLWYNALYNDGGSSSYIASIAPGPGAPAFPASVVNGTLPRSSQNIYTITPNFKNGYAINTSVQITRQLFQNDALTVGYVNTQGRNLEYLRNINLINPIGFLADGRPIYGPASAATRLDPAFNNIALQDTGANSSYNALIVTYNHRLANGLTLNASYTWSHAISDAPEANSYDQGSLFIEDPTNRNRDRGNSAINRPDAFWISSVYAPSFSGINNRVLRYLANDNQLTLSFVAQSGDEQNITGSRVLNGDTLEGSGLNNATRPLYIGRNTARTPNVYQLDMRYTRSFFKLWEKFQPSFFAEANNVLNHPNITSINTNATVNTSGVITAAPTYAPVSTLLEGRIIQLGVRAAW